MKPTESLVYTPPEDDTIERIASDAADDRVRIPEWVYAARIRRIAGEPAITAAEAANAITQECMSLDEMLLAKNRAYGNSALQPIRVFSRADSVEQIRVRIDDKLSRIARGSSVGEDVLLDLIGYLILLRIAERRRAEGEK